MLGPTVRPPHRGPHTWASPAALLSQQAQSTLQLPFRPARAFPPEAQTSRHPTATTPERDDEVQSGVGAARRYEGGRFARRQIARYASGHAFLLAAGLHFGLVLADAGYGASAAFRHGLDEQQPTWAVGIPRTQKVYTTAVRFRRSRAILSAVKEVQAGRPCL